MGQGRAIDDRRVEFEETLMAIRLPSDDSIALDATVVPDRRAAGSSFRDPGPLPSIPVRYPEDDEQGELELASLLGEGGMGRVYLATQRSLGREVAVKTVRDAESGEAVGALCDEGVVMGRLCHPNVIPVHALGRDGSGRPILVMRRVEGVDWRALLRDPEHPFWRDKDVPEEDRLVFHVEVLRQVSQAVAFAHEHGIVHRDIKPENVMLGDFGECYLVDWGLAVRAGTSTGSRIAGTPAYLAPEMVGGVVDARTDVYLLGATLHEILTGAPPHVGESLQATLLSAFLSDAPSFPDDVPEELAELSTRSLSRRPEDRPASAAEFVEGLISYLRHRGSRELARTGQARLEALRRAIEGPGSDPDHQPATESADAPDVAEVRRLVAECRFAFLEARRAWTHNPAVAPGLAACGRLEVQLEIDRGDAEAARAALSQLEDGDPDLEDRIAQLERAQALERAQHERLEKMARDLDPSTDAGVRVGASAVAFVMILGIGAYALYLELMGRLAVLDLFVLSAVMSAGLVAIIAALGRRPFQTTFNRRVVGWVAVCIATELFHRGFALWTGQTDVAAVVSLDMIAFGGLYALGGLFLFRWMLPAGLGLGLFAIPAVLFEGFANTIFMICTVLGVLGFAISFRRGARRDA